MAPQVPWIETEGPDAMPFPQGSPLNQAQFGLAQ
jgi:hypothetical protein